MRAPDGYRLGEPYARDTTGIYYRAVQLKLNRVVTIKVLREEYVEHERARSLFLAERDLVRRLEHPNLLLTLDTGEQDRRPYLVTEWTREAHLGTALREADGPLPEARAVAIALGIAGALGYLAGNKLVYKNLRPSSLLLPRPAAPKLLTFRYVRTATEAGSFRGANVQAGAYCAPELVRDDLGPVTIKANVYALGCLLYRMLAGEPPVPSVGDARAAHARNEVPSLKERRPFLRDRAYHVVDRLMAHDPERRVDPAGAVALLEAWRNDPLLTRPLQRGRRRRRR